MTRLATLPTRKRHDRLERDILLGLQSAAERVARRRLGRDRDGRLRLLDPGRGERPGGDERARAVGGVDDAAPLDAEEGVAPLAGEPVPPLGPTALAPVPDDPSEEVVPPAHGVVAALSVTGSERKPPRPTALTVSRYIVPHLRFVNVAQVNAV